MKKLHYFSVFILYFILGTFLFSITSSAYIDPSAMTYIVQIVVGIIIAGSAAIVFQVRKIKRKFKKKEPVQENYKKQVTFDAQNEDDEFDDSNLSEDEINSSYAKKQ